MSLFHGLFGNIVTGLSNCVFFLIFLSLFFTGVRKTQFSVSLNCPCEVQLELTRRRNLNPPLHNDKKRKKA